MYTTINLNSNYRQFISENPEDPADLAKLLILINRHVKYRRGSTKEYQKWYSGGCIKSKRLDWLLLINYFTGKDKTDWTR